VKAIKLNNWSTTGSFDPYLAPELHKVYLQGFAIGHPKLGDTPVKTSWIVSVRGRLVITYSGSVYKLGRIDPKFRAWLKINRPGWLWRKPITILG
jgi:hypothetical protein